MKKIKHQHLNCRAGRYFLLAMVSGLISSGPSFAAYDSQSQRSDTFPPAQLETSPPASIEQDKGTESPKTDDAVNESEEKPAANTDDAKPSSTGAAEAAPPSAVPAAKLQSIPNGFVRIHFDEPQARWYFFPTGTVSVQFFLKEYGFMTTAERGRPMPQGGVLCSIVEPASVSLGLDLTGRAIDGIIFSNVIKDKSAIETRLVDCINTIVGKPDALKTAADLHRVLNNPMTIAALASGNRDFYLFSPDGKSLQVMSANEAKASGDWANLQLFNTPDGHEKLLADDETTAQAVGDLPIVTPDPYTSLSQSSCDTSLKERLYWTEGSGKNGCLGKLRVANGTSIYTHAVCVPVTQ